MTAPPPLLRFTVDDIAHANAEYGFNCGPAALCACVGLHPDQIRPCLGAFEAKGHMNAMMMKESLERAGFASRPTKCFPIHGLIRVQWCGPWLEPGVPVRARYRYTHWIAAKTTEGVKWVFDVNSLWQPLEEWHDTTAHKILNSIKRADGFVFEDCWGVRCKALG